MASGPVQDQIDDHGAVGPVEGLRPEIDTAFTQGIVPQPATVVGALHHHVAPEAYYVVHGVAGVVGHLLYETDQAGSTEAPVGQQQGSDGVGQVAQQATDAELFNWILGGVQLLRRGHPTE